MVGLALLRVSGNESKKSSRRAECCCAKNFLDTLIQACLTAAFEVTCFVIRLLNSS